VFLLRWIAVAIVAGIVGASLVAAFVWIVDSGQVVLRRLSIPVPVFTVAAALVIGAGVYRVSSEAAGEGVPSYLHALNVNHARFPGRATAMKLVAAVLTFVGFGSGGLVGPLGRVASGSLASVMGRRGDAPAREERARTGAICGMAAVVAALFQAPIGGGIFAVEVIQRANMRYRDLFPAVLAGSVSIWFSRLVGFAPQLDVTDHAAVVELGVLPWAVGFAVVVGVLSGFFSRGYSLAARLFRRNRGRVTLKVVLGSTAAALLVWLVNDRLIGTAAGVSDAVANGLTETLYGAFGPDASLAVVGFTMAGVRAAAAYLTTGSGMSAGLTSPAAQIGMFSGVACAALVAPLASGAVAETFVVVGFVGMLAGAMNVPIGAAVMGMEVFGVGFAVPAAIAAVIAFQLNRHTTIYDFALAGSGRVSSPSLPDPAPTDTPGSADRRGPVRGAAEE
jgi:CIC family chloride channel protein